MRRIWNRCEGKVRSWVPAVCVALFDPIVPTWVYVAVWALDWWRGRLARLTAAQS